MEAHLSRFRIVYLGFVSVLFFYAAGLSAARRMLWFDELFSYYVSNLSDPISVLQALLSGADFHPPLDYLLRHLTMRIFGVSELSFRLPSIVGVWVASLCLYSFVSKRTGAVPGIVAFCFPLTTAAVDFAYEGRSYAVLLAAMSGSLLAWQRAAENPRSVGRLTILSLSLASGPYLHYYGVLNFAPIFVGEVLRSLRNRALSVPILLSIGGSLALLLPLYPFVYNARGYFGGHWASNFSALTPVSYYETLLKRTILAAALSMVVCTGLVCIKNDRESDRPETAPVSIPELGAAFTICLIPFLAYGVALLVTGVLTMKYTLVTILGFALFSGYLANAAGRFHSRYAIGIMLSFYLTSLFLLTVSIRNRSAAPSRLVAEALKSIIHDADSRIVVSNSHEYLQLYHYLPEQARAKIVYLIDRRLSMRHQGFDDGEIAMRNLSRFVPINVVEFDDFTRGITQFVVLDRGYNGWLMKKLEQDRAMILLRNIVGEFSVFLVNIDPAQTHDKPSLLH